MIQLVRRASLLAAFSLLASAATAYAECAWGLWTEVNQKLLRPGPLEARTNEEYPKWEFDTNVHTTRDACELALSREMNSTVSSFSKAGAKLLQPGEVPDFFIRIDERSVTIQRREVFFLIYRYAYLPDTRDPRGPKGGGR